MAVPTSPVAAKPERASGFDVLRFVLAAVLLTAAGLKVQQLADGLRLVPGPIEALRTAPAQLAVAEFELLLAASLASGAYPRALCRVTLACFIAFAAVALYAAISGAASCGCFGRAKINPWVTASLDLAAVGALFVFRPPERRESGGAQRNDRRLLAATVAWALVAVPVSLFATRPAHGPTAGDGVVVDRRRGFGAPGSLVVLEPEQWLGNRFGLAEHVDVGQQLMTGRWTVVLYRYDCDHCREQLPGYEELAQQSAGRDDASRVALVSVPPHAPPGLDPVPSDTACTCGRLDESRDWFIRMPHEVTVEEGVVRAQVPPAKH